jgi:two-component system, NtrC family, response regulator AtoC
MRVLVIEDERLMRWSLAEALTDEGHVVTQAEDGATALRALHSGEPIDAVVLDYELPDSGNLSLLSKIRQLVPSRPIVLITAYGTPALAKAARRVGASEVLLKPFDVYGVGALLQRTEA